VPPLILNMPGTSTLPSGCGWISFLMVAKTLPFAYSTAFPFELVPVLLQVFGFGPALAY
jgi:hypothetical protein